MRKPPGKELCLHMAELNHVLKNERLSWEYLICWGFYEMYVDGWWQE